MALPRFFVDRPDADFCGTIELPPKAAHHAGRALRLAAGEVVALFNGSGRVWTGPVSFDGKRAFVTIEEETQDDRESPVAMTLVQAQVTKRRQIKRWTADIPRLRDEDGEEIDFWSDRAEDRETHYIEGDICEEADRRALVRSFDKTDRRIYWLDRKDFTQQEIARRLHLDQATVSRRLEKIYVRLDLMRLHDGERSPKELAFEVAWEEFLRAGHMRGDADVRAFAFFLRAQGELLALLYKWFFTPGELLRYAARYLMVGGTETKGELLEQLSSYGQAFFARQKFADEVEEKLCLRLLREVERRAATISEPSGNAFHRYEEEIKELAHRRRLPYMFYFEEILMRKYEFKRICKTLSYAKRIASRTRNAAQKAVLRKEIAALEAERIALQRLLSRLAERYAVRHEKRRES